MDASPSVNKRMRSTPPSLPRRAGGIVPPAAYCSAQVSTSVLACNLTGCCLIGIQLVSYMYMGRLSSHSRL